MAEVTPYFEANRSLWNDWTEINSRSDLYDLEGFKRGNTSLKWIERKELPDIRGQALLHLNCHFGMDTLSLAREGATVTGVDISDRAIALARRLADELAISARFIRSNTYDLPQVLDERFDIVFLSYGVLLWFDDLPRLGKLIARYLRRGGLFYMVEFHPILGAFDDDLQRIERSYFFDPNPRRYEEAGTYSSPNDSVVRISYEWQHPVSSVISALCEAGLRIEFLHEFSESPFLLPWFEATESGGGCLEGRPDTLPLAYSIRATKPE